MRVPGMSEEEQEQTNHLNDDVFGSAPSSPVLSGQQLDRSHPSDLPRLRSLHVTNGYREGIALSKESHIQAGFDEGFSLGGEMGQRVGYLLGVLEGIARGLKDDETRGTWEEAQEELKMERLLGAEWFGRDGVWLYHVDGEEDGEVTFEEVAKAHPVLRRWEEKLRESVHIVGLRLNGEGESSIPS